MWQNTKQRTPHPLRAELRLVGLTQQEVSADVDVHQTVLSGYLRGNKPMPKSLELKLGHIIKIKALEVIKQLQRTAESISP